MSEDINQFIDQVMNKDYTGADTTFQTMMANRVTDALDQSRAEISARVYNPAIPENGDD